MTREITFADAILEATDQAMASDPAVQVIGLGATDPKGIFGTTLGLEQRYGPKRVMDMPASENGMTGVAIGAALVGQRPILTHQRADFALLAMDQLVNNAAKWHYMFNGQSTVPLVVRLVVGRGWGQGPQHSQSLQATLAHVPGLKVVVPATPYDAKGLLTAAIEDDNPVIYLEHRWLHAATGDVPEDHYTVPIGEARVARAGSDVTIVASSLATLESLRAAELLAAAGVEAEVVDLRSLSPLDGSTIVESVQRSGRLVVVDGDWTTYGVGAEIVALVAERGIELRAAPRRIAWPDAPSPTTPALAAGYYPGVVDIVNAARAQLELPPQSAEELGLADEPVDVPSAAFTGPF